MDYSRDRLHPVKRNRPIASGKVNGPTAWAIIVILATSGLGVMILVEPLLGVAGGLYAVINIAYSLGLKQVVLLDVFAVASGYVIRAVAGAIAIDVTPSPWLYATTAVSYTHLTLPTSDLV